MANYRNIHCQIWRDPWFMDLLAEERYFFIYLFSNEASSLCGLYRLDMRIIQFETGLPQDRIDTIFAKFEQAGKAVYRDGVVWVVKMQKYNALNMASDKVQARIRSDVLLIPETNPLRVAYQNYTSGNGYRIDTVSIPASPLSLTLSSTPTFAVAVTPPAQPDGDGDGLATPEEYTGPNPESGNAWSVWQQARGGATNTLDDQRLGDLVDEFSEKWVVDAILEANASRTRGLININFVQTILDRWKAEGYKAPRGSPVARADEDAAKRAQANVTRKELYAQNVPRDEVEARIVEFYGQGY